jgi:hypothetical protein
MKKLAIILLSLLSGCASMTEDYWRDRYESMTAEEIEAAKAGSGELVQVCNLTDCIFVWVY